MQPNSQKVINTKPKESGNAEANNKSTTLGSKQVINMGYNEIVGKVKFGEGCIINPTCSIICEGNGEIIFGDYNIIQQKAIIVNKAQQGSENKIMKIGSYNIFSIKSYVVNSDIGNSNILQPKSQLKDSKIGNCNIIGSQTKLSKKVIADNNRLFYPGKMKSIDVFDQQKHKQSLKGLYHTLSQK